MRLKNAWFDSEVPEAKQEKRRKERKWLKTRSIDDKLIFKQASNRYCAILDSKKTQ